MRVKNGATLTLAMLCGAAASVTNAQTTVVVPNAYTSTQASTSGLNTLIRDTGNPRTAQLLINANQLTSVIGQQLTAITWRLWTASTVAYPAANATWADYTINVGTGVAVGSQTTTFATNFVGTPTLVRSGPLTINAGAFPGAGGPPRPFGATINLTTPFTYSGGNLLIEVRHTGSSIVNNTANDFLEVALTTDPGFNTNFWSATATGNTATVGAAANFSVSQLTFQAGGGPTGACCMPDGSCVVTSSAGCTASGGTYQGNGVACSGQCPQPPTGACCFSVDGACFTRTQINCTAAGGTYLGDNSTCSAQNCTPPGACCFADGSCVVVKTSRCTDAGGVYSGDGTKCATANCWTLPTLWNTAKIITAPGTGPGGADMSVIPAGANSIGENENLAAGVRVADDFTIPAGQTWTINKAIVKGYQTGSTTASTFTLMVVRIWDRIPSDPGAVSLFGDITTNVINMTETAFSNVYRAVPATPTDGQRPVMNVVADLPGVVLGPGTYWIEWATQGSLASGPFIPLQTIAGVGSSFLPTGNALIWRNAPWAPVVDTLINAVEYPGGQPVELPFILQGTRVTGAACYPNCDNSTTQPCLNVQDFGCFLNSFANGTTYANCDNSTTPPVLNVQDFGCFLNSFANGCSSC